MKNLKTLFAISLFLLTGCTAKGNNTPTSNEIETEKIILSDMSGYETYNKDISYIYYDMTVEDMISKMDQGDSFVVYFGFETCPWCNDAMPILNEVAQANGIKVGYVNTRKEESWSSNTDIDNYSLLVEKVGKYLSKDDEGNPRLYVPFVFFIKNGEVVGGHEGTVDGHNAHERRIDEEEAEELTRIYQELFEKVKQ